MRKADTSAFAQDLVCDFVERAMNLSEAKEHEVAKRRAARKDEKKLVSEVFQGTARTLRAAQDALDALDLDSTSEHAVASENELSHVDRLVDVVARWRHGFDASRKKEIKARRAIAASAALLARKSADERSKAEKDAHAIFEVMKDVDQQIKGDVHLASLELDPWSFVEVCRVLRMCGARWMCCLPFFETRRILCDSLLCVPHRRKS